MRSITSYAQKASELGVVDKGSGHGDQNLDKALGHAYRAFFEEADWLSIILRERVQKELGEFSSSCINTVLPDYYPEWRPKLDEMAAKISKLRAEKDVADGIVIIPQVREYQQVLRDLTEIEGAIRARRGALLDCQEREKKDVFLATSRGWRTTIGASVVGAIVGALTTVILGFFLGVYSIDDPVEPHESDQPTIDDTLPDAATP